MAPRQALSASTAHSCAACLLHSHPMADGGWVTLCEGHHRTRTHGAGTAPAVRAASIEAISHMSHGCMFGAGRAADRLQQAVSSTSTASIPRCHPAGRHPSRAAGALDRERQRAGHVGREVLRTETQRRWCSGKRRLDHAAEPAKEQADHRGEHPVRRPTAAGISAHEDVTKAALRTRELRSRTSCSTPRWTTWRKACACSTPGNRLIVRNDKYVSMFKADPEVIKPGIMLREVFDHGAKRRQCIPGKSADDTDVARRLAALAHAGKIRCPTTRSWATAARSRSRSARWPTASWVGTVRRRHRAARRWRAEHVGGHGRDPEAATICSILRWKTMAQGVCVFDTEDRLRRRAQRAYTSRCSRADPIEHREARHAAAGDRAQQHGVEGAERLSSQTPEALLAADSATLELGRASHLRPSKMAEAPHCSRSRSLPAGPTAAGSGTFDDITERRPRAGARRGHGRNSSNRTSAVRYRDRNNMAHGLCHVRRGVPASSSAHDRHYQAYQRADRRSW